MCHVSLEKKKKRGKKIKRGGEREKEKRKRKKMAHQVPHQLESLHQQSIQRALTHLCRTLLQN